MDLTFNLPLEAEVLPNGLRVVVSEDRSLPVVGVCVLYRVGSRLEPRGRSGFAHLFEHLMFEGTPRAQKGVFDRVCEASGGSNNGQTRPDVTVYVSTGPVSSLDRLLWLEADRMEALAFSEETLANQREVVKEEILHNVKNDPYGLFEYSELPARTFEKWENAHDGYGDFADLDNASLEDVVSFYRTFYRPSNAVLAVAGDVGAKSLFGTVRRLFGGIPPGTPPPRPDLHEPRRASPAFSVSPAPLAVTPALAAGWRMPPREHEDAWPLLALGELLHNGRASRLFRGLVEGRELATEVWGGFNVFQGGALYDGTTIFVSRIAYRRGVPAESVLAALEEEIGRLAAGDVGEAELSRLKAKIVSGHLHGLESRLDLALELAQATAFDGAPDAVRDFQRKVEAVTPEDLARAAATWLGPARRAAVVKEPS